MKKEKFPTTKPELIEACRNYVFKNDLHRYNGFLTVALCEANKKPKGEEFTLSSLFDPNIWKIIKEEYCYHIDIKHYFDRLVALTCGNIKKVGKKYDPDPTYVNVYGPVIGGPIVISPKYYFLWLTVLLANSLPYGTGFKVEDLWAMKFWKLIDASQKKDYPFFDLNICNSFCRCVKHDDPWDMPLIDLIYEVEIINYCLYKRNNQKGIPIDWDLFVDIFGDLVTALGIDPEEVMDIYDVLGPVVLDNMTFGGSETWGEKLRRKFARKPENVDKDLLYLTVVFANSLPKGEIFKVEDIFGHYKWVDHLWHKLTEKGYSSKLEADFYGCEKDKKPYGLPLIDFHSDTSDPHTTEYVRNEKEGEPIDWDEFFTAFWNVVDALGFSPNDEGFIFGVYAVFDPEYQNKDCDKQWRDEWRRRKEKWRSRREK